MIWDSIIIGAGCAGLSAASKLSSLGQSVLVLERSTHLGGRASSFTDPKSGAVVDNGQHLFLGCYEETKEYLRRIGSISDLTFFDRFSTQMSGPGAEDATLQTSSLPAPFHMASALFRFSALSWKDRMRTIRVARAIGKGGSRLSEISVRQWLAELGQSDAAFTRLWEPLTLATLNMDSAQAPASLLEVVLRDGFLASKEAARVGLSQVGLSQLLGEPAKTYLAGRGSQVRLRSPVKRVKFSNGVHVELVSGEVIAGKSVISAVPPNRALALFSDHPEISDQLKNASHLKPSAIVSAHLWLDQDPFSTPIVGFWGRDIHWAFRKASFSKEPLSPSSHYFSLVTSAAGIMSQISKEAYLDICRSELRAMTGRNIEIMHSVMIREPQATWVPPLTKGNCRPAAKTPIQNFALAGDWTDTGLPCTIEGAVVSGHRGADIIQAYLSSKAHPKTKSPDPDRREARAQ